MLLENLVVSALFLVDLESLGAGEGQIAGGTVAEVTAEVGRKVHKVWEGLGAKGTNEPGKIQPLKRILLSISQKIYKIVFLNEGMKSGVLESFQNPKEILKSQGIPEILTDF